MPRSEALVDAVADRGSPRPGDVPAAVGDRGYKVVPSRKFRYDSGEAGLVSPRDIAEEIPVEIAFGGASYAVMMASPVDLRDFALGFALTEGAIASLGEVRGIDVKLSARHALINVALSADGLRAHLGRKRALAGRTGCGLCGVEDMDHLPKAPRVAQQSPVAPTAIGAAVAALGREQVLNQRTHAVHAAAWVGRDGEIRCVREDVGRHNALDKLIGALAGAKADPADGFLVITSRCSYEMVVKAAMFGAGTLVSVSAPTTLALETAAAAGVRLIAIARHDHALAFPAEHGAAA